MPPTLLKEALPQAAGLSLWTDSPVDTTALSRRFEELRQLRRPWDTAWESLAEHFLPTRFRADHGLSAPGRGHAGAEGLLLNSSLVDATGVLAMRTLASGLHGGMTSPARPWFRLGLEDEDRARTPAVARYLDQCTARMRALFHRSNFYNALHNTYADLGTFGTAFLFELADIEHGFRFLPLPAGEFVLDTDEHRRVDTVFRRFGMSQRQLVGAFGEDALPESLRQLGHRHKHAAQHVHTVVHAVTPRDDMPGCCPYVSVYWLEGQRSAEHSGPHILRQGYFTDFPGFGPRWSTTGNDVYGRSPAMDALPDCRMLQQMGITMLKAAHKAVDPPMSVSASLKSVGLDLTPGGVNYVESAPGQIPQAAAPLINTRPDMAQTRQAMQAVQEQVKAGLFNDLFRLIMDGQSRVTATEIAAREEEKLLLLGPVLERLHGELFIPLIQRTYRLMDELDMLPPLPPELQGEPMRVDFVSLLAQAQKLVATSAVDQYLNFAGTAAKVWPEAIDCVNIDQVADSYAEYLGLEARALRSPEERAQLRAQRAEAQKALAEAEMQAAGQKELRDTVVTGLREAVSAVKTLSETELKEGTALHSLVTTLDIPSLVGQRAPKPDADAQE